VIIEFNEKELEIVEIQKTHRGDAPVYNFPVAPNEAWRAMLRGEPIWIPTGTELMSFAPDVVPENRARGFVTDVMYSDKEKGGPDMFGLKWEFIPSADGSMIEHGKVLFDDANDWEASITWPDIDAWDWDKSAEMNQKALDNNKLKLVTFHNGAWFERLITFMGFENALMALIDEDQQEAVKKLFDRTTDLFCRLVDKCCTYYNIDGFTIHDDWGTQRAPFFSPEVGREMIVPYMRKLNNHIHLKGKIADLHSCGKSEIQVPNFIAAGWDSWCPMAINDTHMLYDMYGDKIALHVVPDLYDVANSTEEEQRAEARKYADRFGKPGTSCIFSKYGFPIMTSAYREELYKYSREVFASERTL
jgi:hypothetical protein